MATPRAGSGAPVMQQPSADRAVRDAGEPTAEQLREVALTRWEYEEACRRLGRAPGPLELGIIGSMWSEHCGYQHSRPLLKRFPTGGPRVLVGAGEENAGVVDIGQGFAIVMKVESHNHPSAVEPFHGAATGVGGILRDIFTMGARPIAILDSLRFGDLASSRSRRLAAGIVEGVGWYGNCVGVPTVGGEVMVDASYDGNPLLNAMCVGLMRHEDLRRARASGAGNPVLLFGADTGRDGLHGATFASLEDPEASHRGVVQVADPFMEKLLIEACLELLAMPGLLGLQDLGATGLTSATVEAASRGGRGMRIDVDRVPRRTEGLSPYEVMLSESQERMLCVVERGHEAEAVAIFERWGLHHAVIGEVTERPSLTVTAQGDVVADLPVAMLVDAPTYTLPIERPAWLSHVQALDLDGLPVPHDLDRAFLDLLGAPNIASRAPIYRRFDHMVGTNTVILPGGDAAVLRIKGTSLGVALATDGNGRLCHLDPREGGRIAVAEAARNVSCVGGLPLAITDCLNFGSPDDPDVYFQLAEVIEGISEACDAFGIPVVSGNVSLYNESAGRRIWPTPVIGMLGLLPDIAERCDVAFRASGDRVVLLGQPVAGLAGSEYLSLVHGQVAGRPTIDLDAELALQAMLRAAVRQGLLRSAHDCSEGGLATAIAESALAGGLGADCREGLLEGGGARDDVVLFGEAQTRVVVSLASEALPTLLRLAGDADVPASTLGIVGGDRLRIGPLDISLDAARAAWEEGLQRALFEPGATPMRGRVAGPPDG
jgi:phosphoribosylformylglycinamidine synthase subunit PurL